MHKALFFEGSLHVTIKPDGPILIKAGEGGGADPALPDMEFVRTQTRGSRREDQVYLPGASLKGVVRAHCERICRSLDSAELQALRRARVQELDPDAPILPLADNPLGKLGVYRGPDDREAMDFSSGRFLEKESDTATVYRRSALTAQMFGHTALAGRVRFADAYAAPGSVLIEERNGVAIDRIYGSVAVGPFNYETVVAGSFSTRIELRNLSLAQLGLLGLALRDLAAGRVALGFGKSRGLGRVTLSFDALELRYPTCILADGALTTARGRAVAPRGSIAGVGALCAGDPAFAQYAFPADDHAPVAGLEPGDAAPPEFDPAAPPAAGLALGPDEWLGVRLLAAGDVAVRELLRACVSGPWRREIAL